MNKQSGLFLSFLLFQTALAHSTTEVELVNERTVDGDKQTYIVNVLYQNDNSRYTFHDPENSEEGAGIYLLSDDGGETAYYIDSNDNSCHHWSNAEFTKTLSEFLLQTRGKFNVEGANGIAASPLPCPCFRISGNIRLMMSLINKSAAL